MTTELSFTLRQRKGAVFRALTAPTAAILLIVKGRKRVRLSGSTLEIDEDSIVLLPGFLPMTIENLPDDTGVYVAKGIPVDDDSLQLVSKKLPREKVASFSASKNRRSVEAFIRTAEQLDDPLLPPAVKKHLVQEILLRLGHDGVSIEPPTRLSLSQKLRSLFFSDLSADWRSNNVAKNLAVSEATLRRRLASEGLSFREILIDSRMTAALGLIQTTDYSVARVAAEVGYESASRFAIRFKKRFGISPSSIRQNKNNETTIEQSF